MAWNKNFSGTKMTDDLEQRVQDIVKKLDTLQLSQEYGQLLKDLYGKVRGMEKDIRILLEEVEDDTDSAAHTLAQRVRYLEAEITQLKSVPSPPVKEFKPGRLGVVLNLNKSHQSYLNGLEIMVINGEQKYYGTTKSCYGKAFYVGHKKEDGTFTSPPDAYCEFTELPGGTYSIEVTYQREKYGLNVTVDGDTFAELKLDTSNLKKNKAEESLSPLAEKTPISTSLSLLKKFSVSTRTKWIAVSLAVALAGTTITYATVQYFQYLDREARILQLEQKLNDKNDIPTR